MRKMLVAVIALLVLLPAPVLGSADEFELNITNTGVFPSLISVGDTVSLQFTIDNVSTNAGEKLWGGLLFIDTDLLSATVADSITPLEPDGVPVRYTGSAHQGSELWPGESTTAVLTFSIRSDAPGGTYLIPVVLTGKRGTCNLGCDPWREEPIYVSLNVIHGIPALSITASSSNEAMLGNTLIINFSVRNLGSSFASSIAASFTSNASSLVSQVNISDNVTRLEPGDSLSGTVAIITSSLDLGEYNGLITVTFKDAKNKSYTQQRSVTFSVVPSDERTMEDHGNEAYDQGVTLHDAGDYEAAIDYLSRAKGYYSLAGMPEEVEMCNELIALSFDAIEELLTPPPCPEPESQNNLLLVGLLVGFAATLAGVFIGLSRS